MNGDDAKTTNTADAVVSVQTGDNTNTTTADNTNTNETSNNAENTNQNQDTNNVKNDNTSSAVNNVVVNVTVVDSDSDCEHESKQNGPERCEMTTDPKPDYDIDVSHMSCEVTKYQVKEVLDAGLRLLQGKPLTKSNIIQITYVLWSVTKKMNVRPTVKKEILLAGISALIDCQENITPIDKQVLKLMVNDIIGQVVDVVTRAKKDGADNCLTRCLSCCLGVPDPPELTAIKKEN